MYKCCKHFYAAVSETFYRNDRLQQSLLLGEVCSVSQNGQRPPYFQSSTQGTNFKSFFIVWVFVVWRADERFTWRIDLSKTDQFWEGESKITRTCTSRHVNTDGNVTCTLIGLQNPASMHLRFYSPGIVGFKSWDHFSFPLVLHLWRNEVSNK